MATSKSIGPGRPTTPAKELLPPSGNASNDQFLGQTAVLPLIDTGLESTTNDETFKLGRRPSVVPTRMQRRHNGIKLFAVTAVAAALVFVMLKCRALKRGLHGDSQKATSEGILRRRLMEQVSGGPLPLGACLMAEDESVVTDTLEDMMAMARSQDIWSPIATAFLSTEGMPRFHRNQLWGGGQRTAFGNHDLASKGALTLASKDAIALYEAGSALLGYFRPMKSLPAWYSTKVQPTLPAIAGALGGWQFRWSLDIGDMAPTSWKVVRAGALIDLNECVKAMKILAELGRPSVRLPIMLEGVPDMSLEELKQHAQVLKYRLNEKKRAIRIQNRQVEDADESLVRAYFGHFPAPDRAAIPVLCHVWKASITGLIVDAGTVIQAVYFQHGQPDLAAALAQAYLRLAARYEESSFLKGSAATDPMEMATMLKSYLQFMAEHWDPAPTGRARSAEHTRKIQALLNFVEPPIVPPRLSLTPTPYHFMDTIGDIEKTRNDLLTVITLGRQDPATSIAPHVFYLIARANHAAGVS